MSKCIFANKKPLPVSKIFSISPFDKQETENLLENVMVNKHIPIDKIDEINNMFDARIMSGVDFAKDFEVFNKISPVDEKVAIVSIFGHVDHGKTALLTALKSMSKIHEVGGITQNISVYNWICQDRKLFLVDTPGHQILSRQREFVSKISDFVIIVIDAEKGIEQQTIEIFKLTENVPKRMICITKIDKNRNVDGIYASLLKYRVSVVKMGGEIPCAEVSVNKGFENTIENLKNIIKDEIELMDLKTQYDHEGIGYVLDSWYQDGLGLMSKIYLKCGSISTSDLIMINGELFNVRSLVVDDKSVKEVNCSNVFVLSGLSGNIVSGDMLYVVNKEYAEYFAKNIDKFHEGKYSVYIGQKDESKKYNFICKANNTSQLQVLCDEAFKHGNIVDVNINAITDSDVSMSSLSNSIFLLYGDFNVNKLRKANLTFICDHIIYKIFDTLEEMHKEVVIEEKELGSAVVKKIFNMKKMQIAGCKVSSGTIKMGRKAKIIRNGEVIYKGSISSMMREKNVIEEAGTNTECGLVFRNLKLDVLEGDIIVSYEEKINS